jgi:hypothetical protein
MNTRTNQSGGDTSVVQDMVFENLGIEDNNLGDDTNLEDDTDLGGPESEDHLDPSLDGQDDPFIDVHEPDPPQRDPQRQDPSRVSHTPQPRPLPKKSEVKADAKGNLLDAQGNIVAKAGVEARLYQGRQKAQRDLATAQSEVADVTSRLTKAIEIGRGLHQQVQAFNAQQQQLKQFGFDANDQIAAMQIFSELRKDPGKAIQKLLTRAAANGITVGSVGNPSGMDPKGIAEAIKEVLTNELKPIRDQQTQQAERTRQEQQQQQELADVQNEVATFFRRNPDAEQFLPVFKRVMADPKYANYSLGEIYARILRANQQRPDGNGRSQLRSRTPQRGSPPNGRNAPPLNGNTMASVDESYDSILKDVMTAAGYQ